MNAILNTGLTFWQWIIGVIVLVLSIVAVKIAVTFDVNKFLERRDKRLDNKIKNTCPHVLITPSKSNELKIQSLFVSPPGTVLWTCSRCGLTKSHNDDYEENYEYWGNNIDEYVKRMDEFEKMLKKGGAL